MPQTPTQLVFPMEKIPRYSRGELWKAPIGKQREELTEILLHASWLAIVIGFMLLIWSARFLISFVNGGSSIVQRIMNSSWRSQRGLATAEIHRRTFRFCRSLIRSHRSGR